MGQMDRAAARDSSEEKKVQDQTNEKEGKRPPFGLITQSFTSRPVSSSSPMAQGGDGRNAKSWRGEFLSPCLGANHGINSATNRDAFGDLHLANQRLT